MKAFRLAFVLMLLTGAAFAQTDSSQSFALKKGQNEFGVWLGGSFHSPTLIGTARERKLLLLGLRYGRVLGGSENVAVEYVADVLPVAIVFQPDLARRVGQSQNTAVYSAGVSPIGFRLVFNRQGRLKPFAETTGGFLYSKHAVPLDIPNATRFNFTFDFGGGVQLFTSAHQAVMMGYKFHHLSNAYRSRVNPGLDGNVFYVGLSLK